MSPAARADAVRNRHKLLQAAAARFAEEGPDAPLEAMARDAGVGIGTLYRHFPRRADLIGAVYAEELAQLGDVASLLERPGSGADALAAWLDERLIGYARAKGTLAPVLRAAGTLPQARAVFVGALDALLAAGRADGSLRDGMDAEDVLRALAGVWVDQDAPDWPQRASRQTAFVLAGLRTT